MSTAYLASTILTGALLLTVGAYLAWSFPWRQWVPSSTVGVAATDQRSDGMPVVAMLLAGVAVVAIGAGIGIGITGSVTGIGAFLGLFGGLLALYVTWGAYHICRTRGMHYAQAVGAGVWFLGMVFLAGIIAKLLLNG